MKQTIKRKVHLLLVALLLMPLHAAATPANLAIEEFGIRGGETKEMLIDLNCPDGNITLVQFDMKLPTGLSIVKEDGEFLVDIAGRTTWKKHSLNTSVVGTATRFLLASNTNALISGTSGALISVTLQAASNFNGGEISLENILLVTPKQEETKPATYVYTIKGVVPVTSITLSESTYELTAGQTFQLSANVAPSNATDKSVKWSSSNAAVATVSENGLVSAIAVGSAVITCEAKDGSGVKANCSVTVKAQQPLSPIIQFADAEVKRICVENWDTNGDGELSEAEAAAVTSLDAVFEDNAIISSFDELQYFTGVRMLGDREFSRCYKLSSIVLPKGLQSIGRYAFSNCVIPSIIIPASVEFIDKTGLNFCFENIYVDPANEYFSSIDGVLFNKGATFLHTYPILRKDISYIVPDGVLTIGESAFYASGLKSVVLPDGLKQIKSSAFRYCRSLETIKIPESVETIEDDNFEYCDKLVSFFIPSSVFTIGNSVLSYCQGLQTITVDPNNEYYSSVDGILFSKNQTRLLIFPGGRKDAVFEIPSHVTAIGASAFYGHKYLTSVIIHKNVSSIGSFAFVDCFALTSMTLMREEPYLIGNHVLPGSTTLAKATLYVPYGCKAAYEAADGWKNFKTIVEMPAEPLTLTAKSYTREYGEQNSTFEYLAEGATFTGVPEIICDAHANSAVGTYPIIIRQGSVDNNNVTFVNGTLTITKAPLTITAKSYTVKQGETLPQFEADYSGFKNGETSSVLAKQPQLSCSVQDSSEPGTYPIRIYGAEAKNYEIALVEGTLVIEVDEDLLARKAANEAAYARLKKELDEVQMHLSEVAVMIAGDDPLVYADYQMPIMMLQNVINAARKALDDAYENVELTTESTTTAAEIMTRIDQMKQDADYAQYQAAKKLENDEAYERLVKELDELQQELDNAEVVVRALGDELYRELVDDITNIKAQIAASRAEIESRNKYVALTEESTIPNENKIRQAISKVLAEADALAKQVVISVVNCSREYGEQNPKFTYNVNGGTLQGEPEIICDARANSAVGTYPVILRRGSITNPNVQFMNGTLTITKAQLTITAKSYTIKQGEALPQFEADYGGFKNGETSSVLTKQPQFSCSVQDSSEPGTYPIRIYGAEAKNYDIEEVDGVLTIEEDEAGYKLVVELIGGQRELFVLKERPQAFPKGSKLELVTPTMHTSYERSEILMLHFLDKDGNLSEVQEMEMASQLLIKQLSARSWSISGLQEHEPVMVYDLQGRLVQKERAQSGETVLNLSHLPKGIYIININNKRTIKIQLN